MLVKQGLPLDPCGFAAPQATARRADVDNLRTIPLDINGGDTTAHGTRTNVPYVHLIHEGLKILALNGRRKKKRDGSEYAGVNVDFHHN